MTVLWAGIKQTPTQARGRKKERVGSGHMVEASRGRPRGTQVTGKIMEANH